jgi:hypothetical protein
MLEQLRRERRIQPLSGFGYAAVALKAPENISWHWSAEVSEANS